MADGRRQNIPRTEEQRRMRAISEIRANPQEYRNRLDTWRDALERAENELHKWHDFLVDRNAALSRKEAHLDEQKEQLAKEKEEFCAHCENRRQEFNDLERDMYDQRLCLVQREKTIREKSVELEAQEEAMDLHEGALHCTDPVEEQRKELDWKRDFLNDLEQDIHDRRQEFQSRKEAGEAKTAQLLEEIASERQTAAEMNLAVDKERAEFYATHEASMEELKRRGVDLRKQKEGIKAIEERLSRKEARWQKFDRLMELRMKKALEGGGLNDLPREQSCNPSPALPHRKRSTKTALYAVKASNRKRSLEILHEDTGSDDQPTKKTPRKMRSGVVDKTKTV